MVAGRASRLESLLDVINAFVNGAAAELSAESLQAAEAKVGDGLSSLLVSIEDCCKTWAVNVQDEVESKIKAKIREGAESGPQFMKREIGVWTNRQQYHFATLHGCLRRGGKWPGHGKKGDINWGKDVADPMSDPQQCFFFLHCGIFQHAR